MDRRTYLRTAAVGVTTGVAGCMGLADSHPNVTLSKPDRDGDITSEDLPYTAWGQQVPDDSVPAPLEDRTVALRKVDKPSLITFFYSYCQTVCPTLISTLRNVQTHALNNGYATDVAFLPISFDPARDDADRLREYADKMHVKADAGDWHFLRPKSKARAKKVVQKDFGLMYETKPKDDGNYMFNHAAMILLVNADGYVERAYRGKSPQVDQILSDLKKVRS